MRRLAPLIPVLLILLAPPAMLWTLWVDPLSAGEDDMGYYYPLRVMVGRALADGRWPAENPLEATGAPLLADPQSAVFHPATWLFAAAAKWEPAKWGLSPPSAAENGDSPHFLLAYTLSLFVGYWLAGGGAYLYLRRLGLVRAAACFGTVAFMFSGFFVGHRVHLSVLQAGAMLPWGLWCIERLRVSASPRPRVSLPWLVPIIYLAIAAGHWPTLIHVSILWAAYFAFRARPVLRSAGVWVAAGAIAALAAGPQLAATFDLMSQATRERLGYATAGENSFFPAAGVLALFPFLLGNRNPNFFSQPWWGPWHQCEMLGYVGLATLVLAVAAVWRLYRKPRPGLQAGPTADIPNPKSEIRNGPDALRPLVRGWTWIAIGAGVWMLGYYLPTYRLVFLVPVLNVLRCPARMVLGVELALATLAAIAIHVVSNRSQILPDGSHANVSAPSESAETQQVDSSARLMNAVRCGVTVTLPLAMLGTLVLLAFAAYVLPLLGMWNQNNPFFVGGPREARQAIFPTNPAVWVAALVCLATAAAILWWLRSPARRSAILVVLVLADLFFLTRFVDVPPNVRRPDLSSPPAALWLAEHGGPGLHRVWGLSETYFHRQRELLLPKTCCLYGQATIASYGPFQSPAHAHLLGFNICGYNRDWADLLRRNRLISLYNVRYILAEANSEHEDVLRSVRVEAAPPMEEGPNLVGRQWKHERTGEEGDTLRLRTPFLWSPSECRTTIALEPNTLYRISLEARGPRGGAANYLRADVFYKAPDYSWWQPSDWGLTVPAEQMVPDWRLFRWTFRTEANFPRPLGFRLQSMSERPIEVRGLAVRKVSGWDSPEEAGELPVGASVYRRVAELPATSTLARGGVQSPFSAAEDGDSPPPNDPPVVIYENLLARSIPIDRGRPNEQEIEELRWKPLPPGDWKNARAPNVGLAPVLAGSPTTFALATSLPAGAGYGLILLVTLWRSRRRG